MEKDHKQGAGESNLRLPSKPAGFTEHGGSYYFGIYVDSDPYRIRLGLQELEDKEVGNTSEEVGQSAFGRKSSYYLGIYSDPAGGEKI